MTLPILYKEQQGALTTEVVVREQELNFVQVLADILQAKIVMDKASEIQGLKAILAESVGSIPEEWSRAIALDEAWIRHEIARLAARYQGHMLAKSRRLGLKRLARLANPYKK